MSSPVEPGAPRAAAAVPRAAEAGERLRQLPPFTRSLLRIEVPVRVALASAKLPLKEILKLAPGAIIPLSKSCTEPLTLSVSNRSVAVGEAVTVGDRLGLRITSMGSRNAIVRAAPAG